MRWRIHIKSNERKQRCHCLLVFKGRFSSTASPWIYLRYCRWLRKKIGSSSSPSGEQSWHSKRLSTEEKLKEEKSQPKKNCEEILQKKRIIVKSSLCLLIQCGGKRSSVPGVAHQDHNPDAPSRVPVSRVYKGPDFCIFISIDNVL